MAAVRFSRPIFARLISRQTYQSISYDVTNRNCSSLMNRAHLSTPASSAEPKTLISQPPEHYSDNDAQKPQIPIKSILLTIEAKLTKLAPNFLKNKMIYLYEILSKDVEFEDKKYGFTTRGLQDFHIHLAKIRIYFRFKSPFNKFQLIGTAVYEDQKYVTALYRLQSLNTSILTTYNPFYFVYSIIRGKRDEMVVMEGALDFHINDEGLVSKVVSREATLEDIEGAKQFSQLKKESEQEFQKRFELDNTPYDALDWRKGLRKS